MVTLCPGKSAGISVGFCLLTMLRTHPSTAQVVGAIVRSEPEADETRIWNDHRYQLSGVPFVTPKAVRRRRALPGSVLSKCDAMRRGTPQKQPVLLLRWQQPNVWGLQSCRQDSACTRFTRGWRAPHGVTVWPGAVASRRPLESLDGKTGTIIPSGNITQSIFDAPNRALRFHARVGTRPKGIVETGSSFRMSILTYLR